MNDELERIHKEMVTEAIRYNFRGESEENYVKPQSEQLISRIRLEPSAS
jgi:hypothetical protein